MSAPTTVWPCTDCPAPDVACAFCGRRNRPGHARREHTGFVPVLSGGEEWHACIGCAGALLLRRAEWAEQPGVALLLVAPRTEVAR